MKRITKSIALAASLLLITSACSSEPEAPAADVIATTTVWADITKSIAGDKLTVESLLTNPNQDPHSYEATPRDQLKINKAKLIIAACNETDSFIKQLVDANTNLLCLDTEVDGNDNPHLWYNLSRTRSAVLSIRQELVRVSPSDETYFNDNFQTFVTEIESLIDKASNPTFNNGLEKNPSFVALENVGNDLLQLMGLKDLTPASVIQAGLNETDLSPQEMQEAKAAIQQAGAFTINTSQWATQENDIYEWIPANAPNTIRIGFAEQLPTQMSYLDWMSENIKQVTDKLAGTEITQ